MLELPEEVLKTLMPRPGPRLPGDQVQDQRLSRPPYPDDTK